MSGKGWSVTIGIILALLWLSQMSGKEAVTAIVFFLVGAAVALAIVSLTGGTAAGNAKRSAEEAKRLAAREKVLDSREANLSREVLMRARQIAEQMYAAWKANYEATYSAPQPQAASFEHDYQWSEAEL